ncbi:hypothetical protein EPIR_0002 [Erwinia piriflorinigrans CFBP 5888]|uniref:Uncharacterized protein n=1 Tax=Erwinia piriflorinigrans CFBP 5888 TaxID=1161919 RepID=V5Z2L9_9GAMM|nr:hypothetical protein EPIR_0002 [Erwinia piriflorinigrans CFBP 5888]
MHNIIHTLTAAWQHGQVFRHPLAAEQTANRRLDKQGQLGRGK